MTILYVAIGGVAGALGRYGLGTAVSTDTLPWLTVGINVVGSFVLGAVVSTGGHWFSPELRTGLAVGLLGGFTTFSTFSVDVFLELEAGDAGEALAYLAASVVLGVVAAGLGYHAGRGLVT